MIESYLRAPQNGEMTENFLTSTFHVDSKETGGLTTETYEIKDDEGTIICNATVEFEQEIIYDIKVSKKRLRLVKSFLINNGDKTIDVLKFTNIGSPTKIYCVLGKSSSSDYFSDSDLGCVVIPSPTSSSNIAAALHELGHAKQFDDDLYKSLVSIKVNSPFCKNPKEYSERILKLIPEAKSQLPTAEQLEEMDKFVKKLSEIDERMDVIGHELEKIEEINILVKERSLIAESLKKLLDPFSKNGDYLEKLLERDATRHAFKWIKKINSQIDTKLSSSNFLLSHLEGYDALGKIPVPAVSQRSKHA